MRRSSSRGTASRTQVSMSVSAWAKERARRTKRESRTSDMINNKPNSHTQSKQQNTTEKQSLSQNGRAGNKVACWHIANTLLHVQENLVFEAVTNWWHRHVLCQSSMSCQPFSHHMMCMHACVCVCVCARAFLCCLTALSLLPLNPERDAARSLMRTKVSSATSPQLWPKW